MNGWLWVKGDWHPCFCFIRPLQALSSSMSLGQLIGVRVEESRHWGGSRTGKARGAESGLRQIPMRRPVRPLCGAVLWGLGRIGCPLKTRSPCHPCWRESSSASILPNDVRGLGRSLKYLVDLGTVRTDSGIPAPSQPDCCFQALQRRPRCHPVHTSCLEGLGLLKLSCLSHLCV